MNLAQAVQVTKTKGFLRSRGQAISATDPGVSGFVESCGLVAKRGGSYNLGEYFGTAVRKRKVHWPKGQVVANLFRAGPVVV
jgi:hypothetical protein